MGNPGRQPGVGTTVATGAIDRMVAEKWVEVWNDDTQATFVRRSDTCLAPVRKWRGEGGLCLLSPGHRGYHSTQVGTCNECHKRRRYSSMEERAIADGDDPDYEWFCFFCLRLLIEFYDWPE
jgi:hypothetical protein